MKTHILTGLLCLGLMIEVSGSPVDMMTGARGYGLGGAYVALANDPSAAYWNPSRLSQVKHISLMNSNWIMQDVEGMNVNYANLTVPIKYVGTISGSWLINHAELEYGEFDEDGEVVMKSGGANEHQFSLSLGRQLFDELLIFRKTSVGLSVNRYSFTTEFGNGAGLGFDVGISTEFPYGLSLGFTARTLGAEFMGNLLDPELRWGIGYSQVIKEMHRITAGVDGLYKMNRDYQDIKTLEPATNNIKGFAGVEYAFLYNDFEIAVRGGGNGMAWRNTMHNYTFTAGCGFKWLGYSLQYAFMGVTDRDAALGYGHRVSLILELDRLYLGQKGVTE